MSVWRPDGRVRVYLGDCLDFLPTLPTASVGGMVVDPPAGLGFRDLEWDDFRRSTNLNDSSRESLWGRLSRRAPQIGRSGMFEYIEYLTTRWAECRRVVVPGGLAIVWSHAKTSDWTSLSMRLAGWERIGWRLHVFANRPAFSVMKPSVAAKVGHPCAEDCTRSKPCAGKRHTLFTEFAVGAVEPWLVFRNPSSNYGDCYGQYGSGYFDMGSRRLPRGSLPKDVELVCECGGVDHADDCPVRLFGENGRSGRNGSGAKTKNSANSLSHSYGLQRGRARDSHVTTYGDSGTFDRYFQHHVLPAPKVRDSITVTRDELDGHVPLVVKDDKLVRTSVARYKRTPRRRRLGVRGGERHEGCEHLLWLAHRASTWEQARYGEWLTADPRKRAIGNVHATVKARDLLAPLITAAMSETKVRVLLDPFAGSGSTLTTALNAGFSVVGAERDENVAWPILRAKVENAL